FLSYSCVSREAERQVPFPPGGTAKTAPTWRSVRAAASARISHLDNCGRARATVGLLCRGLGTQVVHGVQRCEFIARLSFCSTGLAPVTIGEHGVLGLAYRQTRRHHGLAVRRSWLAQYVCRLPIRDLLDAGDFLG